MWLPTRPKEVDKIIKSYTKAKPPHFFEYAKDKAPSQVEPVNTSAMNRISSAIVDNRIKWSKSIGKIDYRILLNKEYGYTVEEGNPIITLYNYWVSHQFLFNHTEENTNEDVDYMYHAVRKDIIDKTGCSVGYIVNSLVAYMYTLKPNSAKKMLWGCFGAEIVENIKNNLDPNQLLCPICGKRFTPVNGYNTMYCSPACLALGQKEKRLEWREKSFVNSN